MSSILSPTCSDADCACLELLAFVLAMDVSYSTPQITHEWTWRQLIAVDSNMSTKIPAPFNYFGHDVELPTGRYELWSPNSPRIPPYPGV